jgi:demethylmenaquinone methyltransferase/2-methoxy-6-polyprenyl-1,4-benzoquinol methylase
MDACVPPAAVLGALQAAGFAAVKRDTVLGLFSEYTAMKA